MPYRRISYRYVFMAGSPLRPLGALPQADRTIGLAQLCWRPPSDVYETPDEVVVTAELPGLDDSEIDIQLFDDALVVQGQRRLPRPEGDARYQAAEIRQGPFRLEVPLAGAIDSERVDARLERGLLTVTLPKARRA
jgi:HSP20 family protein